MKLLRPLLLVLGVLAALLAAAVVVALVPGVQRWAVLRAASSRPGITVRRLDGIAASPGHLSLHGAELTRSGVTLKVESMEVDYSLFSYLFGSRIVVDRLTVRGLDVDAGHLSRRKAEAGVAAAPAAAPGALAHVAVPYQLVIGTVDVQGRARLPGAPGRESVQSEFTITGGDLYPGREGTLHLQARLVDPSVSARVGVLQARVDLLMRQALNHAFDRVGLNALIEASGASLNGQDQLRLAAELLRATNGENYRVRLDTVRAGTATTLLSLNALLPTAGAAYRGDWSLTARSEQIEPFFMGGPLPRFDLSGGGDFVLDPSTRSGSLKGNLQGQAGELGVLLPALRAVGTVRLKGSFDCSVDQDIVRLAGFDLNVAGEAPVAEIHLSRPVAFSLREHRLELGAAPAGELLRLNLGGLPLAWIRPFVTSVDLSGGALAGSLVLTGAGERNLQFRTDGPLRLTDANVARAGRLLLAKSDASLELSADISPAAFSVTVGSLKLVTAAGDRLEAQGGLSGPLGRADPAYVVSGRFQADLPKLLAPWTSGGHLKAKGSAELTVRPTAVELRHLDLATVDGHDRPLLTAALSRGFTLDLQKFQTDAGDGEVELGRVGLGAMSLASLPLNGAGLALVGQSEAEDYRLFSRRGQFLLRAQSPVKVAGLGLKRGGQPIVEQLNLELSPVVEMSGRHVARMASGDIRLRDAGGAELAQLSAELTQNPEGLRQANVTFSANLAALAGQPALGALEALLSGRASGEVRAASGGGSTRLEARATLNGLVLREDNQPLPVANLTLRTDMQPDGRFALQAPILLDRSGERSDLNLTMDGTRTPQGVVFDAKIAGEHADLADALALLGVLGAPVTPAGTETEAQARRLSPPAADTQAFWQGFQGQLALDLKSVTRGKTWNMSGLTGRLVLEPARVQLQKLEADFGEKSRLSAMGVMTFAPGQNPYALQGTFSLTEFDAGQLFKALEPGRPPTVEGLFTFAGQAEGQGLTLADTLDRLRGQFQLTSRQGIFRGLKRTSEKLSVASKAVELGAALGAIFGTDKVKQAAEKVAGHSYLIDQFAQMLGELNYDQLSLRLQRGADLNVQLQDLSLVAPEVRLLGSGQITYVAGQPLLEQPLNVSVTLAGRGKVEQMLGKLRELEGTRDELGYAKSRSPITIAGTMAKPDPMPYFRKMAASKLTDYLSPDN